MSPEPGKRKDGITHDIVRFLAWLKKLGRTAAAALFRKKWTGKGSISGRSAGGLPDNSLNM